MAIIDTLVTWYAQNVIIPKMEEINHPGFIITNVSEASSTISLRELALPESIFIELENKIIEKFGNQGKQILYSIGKKYGHGYASLSNLKQISDSTSEKEFKDFVYYFVMYVSCIFASGASPNIDLKTRKFEVDFKDYIVCRKNGQGYIMTIGGSAGVWSYMFNDPSLEGTQTLCSGRGDGKCRIIVAPTATLDQIGVEYFRETNLPITPYSTIYQEMNKIRKTEYSKDSLEEMINNNFISYEKGKLSCMGERYFICESSLLYYLEIELQKLDGGNKILFDISFDYGHILAKNISEKYDYETFIPDFLSALGYGDSLIINKDGKIRVLISYFPWCENQSEVQFTMIRGIISGMISGFTKKRIVLNASESPPTEGYLNVILTE